jgi:hypothetical protein
MRANRRKGKNFLFQKVFAEGPKQPAIPRTNHLGRLVACPACPLVTSFPGRSQLPGKAGDPLQPYAVRVWWGLLHQAPPPLLYAPPSVRRV